MRIPYLYGIVPTKEFQGISGLNPYADFVIQTDHTVGQILKALDRNGLTENTLIIFTSDNGCSPEANFGELEEKGIKERLSLTKEDIRQVPPPVRADGLMAL